jgi:5-methylthioadenosine/S-adenosylhomocysteine deaminase
VPLYNIYAQIVYALKGEDVRTVIIGGRIVMQDRRILTLDQPGIIARASRYAMTVMKTLKAPQGDPSGSLLPLQDGIEEGTKR